MPSVTSDNFENYFMTFVCDNLKSGPHRSEMSVCYKFLCALFLSAAGREKWKIHSLVETQLDGLSS
jgi:hypothetical protein